MPIEHKHREHPGFGANDRDLPMLPSKFTDALLDALGLVPHPSNIVSITIHADYEGDLPVMTIRRLATQADVDAMKDAGIKIGERIGERFTIAQEYMEVIDKACEGRKV